MNINGKNRKEIKQQISRSYCAKIQNYRYSDEKAQFFVRWQPEGYPLLSVLLRYDRVTAFFGGFKIRDGQLVCFFK